LATVWDSDPLAAGLFLCFGFAMQLLLIANFAARNLRPGLELRYGWVVYLMGAPALLLAVWFALRPLPWYIVAAPLLYAVWSVFGFYVDRYRGIPWRNPPNWPVLIPYLGLFILAQFAFWIPLWYVAMTAWWAYTFLYAVNTGLNIYSHKPRRPPA
jgi:hypothetical protein